MYRISIIILLFSLSFACSAYNEETEKEEKKAPDFGWELAIDTSLVQGGSIVAGSKEKNIGDWLNISLLFDLYYKRFFIQSNRIKFSEHNRGAAIGYHIMDRGEWQLDLIHSNYISGFNENNVGLVYMDEIEELKGIDERHYDANTGFRFTRTKEDSQLSFDVVADIVDNSHNGWLIEGYYSKVMPYRNWDFYLGTGINFYSSEVTNYYYGIKAHEATENRRQYKPGIGYKLLIETVAQYPLSESWLFNVGVSVSHHSPSIAKSPITRGQHLVQGMIILRYVF